MVAYGNVFFVLLVYRILPLLIYLQLIRLDWDLLLTSLSSTMRFSTHLIVLAISPSRFVFLIFFFFLLCGMSLFMLSDFV